MVCLLAKLGFEEVKLCLLGCDKGKIVHLLGFGSCQGCMEEWIFEKKPNLAKGTF